MTIYNYSPAKNFKLKEERNISFEEVIAAIENGKILDIIKNSNRKKYDHQYVYIIQLNDYVYLVPFIEDDNGNVFLKTIIPSRKAKQKYKERTSGKKNQI